MSRRFGAVSTDNVNVGHYTEIDALNEVTVFIRAYRTGPGGGNLGRYVSKAQGSNNDWNVYHNDSVSGTQFDANRWPTAGQWRMTQISQSNWYSICFTYSFSATTNKPLCYLTRLLQTRTDVTTPSGTKGAGTSDICAGNSVSSGGTRAYAGDLADMAVWNRILSAGEVSIVHFLGPQRVANGLVLFLPMNGDTSPEPNYGKGSKTGTVTGATKGRLVVGGTIDQGRISRFGV